MLLLNRVMRHRLEEMKRLLNMAGEVGLPCSTFSSVVSPIVQHVTERCYVAKSIGRVSAHISVVHSLFDPTRIKFWYIVLFGLISSCYTTPRRFHQMYINSLQPWMFSFTEDLDKLITIRC